MAIILISLTLIKYVIIHMKYSTWWTPEIFSLINNSWTFKYLNNKRALYV